MFHFGKATRQRPGLGAAPSTLSCCTSACSRRRHACVRGPREMWRLVRPGGPVRSLPGDPVGPNRRRASSGTRSSSSRRCSGRSTHRTPSPRRPRWPTCSRAAVPKVQAVEATTGEGDTTNLSGLTTFWEIVLRSATAALSTRSATGGRHGLRERVVGALRSRDHKAAERRCVRECGKRSPTLAGRTVRDRRATSSARSSGHGRI